MNSAEDLRAFAGVDVEEFRALLMASSLAPDQAADQVPVSDTDVADCRARAGLGSGAFDVPRAQVLRAVPADDLLSQRPGRMMRASTDHRQAAAELLRRNALRLRLWASQLAEVATDGHRLWVLAEDHPAIESLTRRLPVAAVYTTSGDELWSDARPGDGLLVLPSAAGGDRVLHVARAARSRAITSWALAAAPASAAVVDDVIVLSAPPGVVRQAQLDGLFLLGSLASLLMKAGPVGRSAEAGGRRTHVPAPAGGVGFLVVGSGVHVSQVVSVSRQSEPATHLLIVYGSKWTSGKSAVTPPVGSPRWAAFTADALRIDLTAWCSEELICDLGSGPPGHPVCDLLDDVTGGPDGWRLDRAAAAPAVVALWPDAAEGVPSPMADAQVVKLWVRPEVGSTGARGATWLGRLLRELLARIRLRAELLLRRLRTERVRSPVRAAIARGPNPGGARQEVRDVAQDPVEIHPVLVTRDFPARPSSVPDVRDFVRQHLARTAMPDDDIRLLGGRMADAVLYRAGTGRTIRVSLRIFTNHAEVDVLHSGEREATGIAGRTGRSAPNGDPRRPQWAPEGPDVPATVAVGTVAVAPRPALAAAPGPTDAANRRPDVSFAEWLAATLRDEGMTMEAAARRLNVSVKTVSRWVAGATEPRLRDLSRIREVFGELPFP